MQPIGASSAVADDITKLYRLYVTMLRHTCRRILGDGHMAEDVVQESFIAFIDYAKKCPVDHPGAVLYRIATRLAVKRLRSSKTNTPIDEHRVADERHQAPEHRLAVLKVLLKADEEEAQVAIMHFVEGMSHEEIAEVMDVSRRTIGNRLESFCRRAAKQMTLPDRSGLAAEDEYDLVALSLKMPK